MQVEYKGTQYIHKFTQGEEVNYVTCSNEDFEKIIEKPSLDRFEYQYTVSGILEEDTKSLEELEARYTEQKSNLVDLISRNTELLTDAESVWITP